MTQAVLEEVVKAEGFTLSQIIWRLLRRQPKGFVEAVLAFNPELADQGYQLPVGTVVRIPLDAIPSADMETSKAEVISLWD